MKRIAIVGAVLLGAMVFAQVGVQLYDEGVPRGQASRINCSGVGINCFMEGGVGTVRVAAPSVDGVLSVTDAGTIGCNNASAIDAGCVSTGAQEFAGAKTFKAAITSEKSITVTGANEDVQAPYVAATVWSEAPIFTTGNLGQTTILMGMKSSTDPGPDIDFWSYQDRDAGIITRWMNGYLGQRKIVATVDNLGTVRAGCNQDFPTSAYAPSFEDCSTASGHIALSSPGSYYLGLQGLLSNDHNGIDADGGHPLYDGGTWVQCCTDDGGTFYSYGGFHGNTTIRAGTGASGTGPQMLPDALYGGLLLELQNPQNTGGFTDKKWWVDSSGFYGTSHGLTFAQLLAEGSGVNILTNLGQFRFGHRESATSFAFDSHRPVFWTNLTMLESPATVDVLSVHGGEADPRGMENGKSTLSTGTKVINFASAFTGTPNCSCADTTAHNGCFIDSESSTSATFAGTGSDDFDWHCEGPE